MKPNNDSFWLTCDGVALILWGVVAAVAAVPFALAVVGIKMTGWLIAHEVLVPADQALFTLPLLDAGPDLHQLFYASLGMLGLFMGAIIVPKLLGPGR